MLDDIVPGAGGGTELTFEQELDAILNPGTTPVPGSVPSGADKAVPPAASPAEPPIPPTEPPIPPTEEPNPLLTALDEIKDDTPAAVDDKTKPALTEEQQEILRVAPELRTIAENHRNFENTLANGSFEQIEGMFKAWNPTAYDKLLENVYEKFVASGEWVDRFIAERDPEKNGNFKQFKSLETKIANLESQLQEKKQGTVQERAAQAERQAFTTYSTHVTALLDQIKFSEADRPWVISALNTRVSADPKLMAEIRKGNTEAVNKLFKTTVREYVTRDKAVSSDKAAKIDVQAQKKAPIGGGAATQDAVPDDINQVKPEDRETWLDQGLAKLARLVGK